MKTYLLAKYASHVFYFCAKTIHDCVLDNIYIIYVNLVLNEGLEMNPLLIKNYL